ncbi:MAG: LacI family DNA-binding transcriptional regulator [Devosia sp.]|uniref:LacI family DNA-binding transcriptional regulator n=1 Tax=Devosia sp. TaxID=1871048 RepID=UPI0024CCB745|nr:LacI family DNA-binding transcriptional regulator [Devosia sp.]UYN98948.1 MAG: LacI family DNA-binding transcriptional regulator [Devosia sp.]
MNLRDVAAHARVSVATASRVFSDNPNVNAESRERVLASAQELGYVVNGLARAMMGRGRQSIAFVVRAMIGPTFAALAAGVESVAGKNGHMVLMSATEGDAQREHDLIHTLRELRVRSVLLVGSTESDASFDQRAMGYARDLAQVKASLILCGRPPIAAFPELVSVNYDHSGGVAAGVDELVRLGHTRIAYIGEGRGMTTAELRLGGYEAALARHGIPLDPQLVRLAANSEAAGAQAATELLQSGIAVTAIVTMTDNIAIGAYRAARSLGVSLPDQLSIIGFDDAPVVADLTPALTTVHPPFFELGVRAAEIALDLAPAAHVLLPTTFMKRGSAVEPNA